LKLKHWLAAARLRTLPLSVSGIIVGCSLADFKVWNFQIGLHEVAPSLLSDYSIFILATLTTIGFQILSNFANDYGDGVKGTDNIRIGEQRLVASGIISPKQMKRGIIIITVLTLCSALVLIYQAFRQDYFWYSVLFFVLGIASIAAAIKYTVGKKAYGYSGFGDVFVFLFFGWLSVVGSYFLYTKIVHLDVFLPATTIGMLSIAVLNLNNMRDRIEDAKVNKNTLVVKMGSQQAKRYHYFLILVALVCAIGYVELHYYSPKQYLFLIAFIPLIHNIIIVARNIIHKELDSELKKVALSTFLFAILFAIFSV